jgi:hypothetical protein
MRLLFYCTVKKVADKILVFLLDPLVFRIRLWIRTGTFLGLPDPDPQLLIRIRIIPLKSKQIKILTVL